MLNKLNINHKKQILIIYIALILATLAVYWQVNQLDFINCDDPVYVTENIHIQSGITPDGIRWAFSTTYAEFWHPLTWISLMLDYQLYGLNAGGYHLTNLILHILSTLLLFWLFNRMTSMIWRSAFVAALFALHPLHVESVVWIAERKDVLSAFFFMLTLCLYVYYTEKPAVKRYLPVLFCFACALMSKPMAVILPVILILLDYWPLSRFRIRSESKEDNLLLWQLKEKTPFFVLSAVFSIITLYAQYRPTVIHFPLGSRIANALVSFVVYLEKTFWPRDLAVFYPFVDQLPIGQVLGAALLIIIISVAVILMVKRSPYLFVGWLWYAIILLPVIGFIQINSQAMADHYTYLPLIGISIMLAWGMPLFFKTENMRKIILFPAAISFLAIMSVLTYQQCSYWKNSIILFSHALQTTKNNFMAYNNRGVDYDELGQYQNAIEDYDEAIRLKPNYIEAYNNRGVTYSQLGKHKLAIGDFNKVIGLSPDHVKAYYNRGLAYFLQGDQELGCLDAQKACKLENCKLLEYANNKKLCH